eukprot:1179644-Prorocentrum_minimum.AAC.2
MESGFTAANPHIANNAPYRVRRSAVVTIGICFGSTCVNLGRFACAGYGVGLQQEVGLYRTRFQCHLHRGEPFVGGGKVFYARSASLPAERLEQARLRRGDFLLAGVHSRLGEFVISARHARDKGASPWVWCLVNLEW